MDYLWICISLVVIMLASDKLVDAAASIALKLKVPKILVAFTIMSFGTCMPELSISFASMAAGNASIPLANVIGSSVINIVLVVGITCLMRPIKVKEATIKSELPLLLLVTSVFGILLVNRMYFLKGIEYLQRIDGILLLVMFLMFIVYLIRLVKNSNRERGKPKYSLVVSLIILIISLIAIYFASEVLVTSAVKVANIFGVSEKVITMVVIVIGTSLPELIMTITATIKKEYDMAIGNIVGTNIFNICVVLGLPLAVFGKIQIVGFNIVDVAAVFFATLLLYAFAKSEKKLSKAEGGILIFLFVVYYFFVIVF